MSHPNKRILAASRYLFHHKFTWVFVTAILLVFAVPAFIVFGNPQWNKHIYLIQAYKYPGIEPTRPEKYTGTWREWTREGILVSEADYKNGQQHGKSISWRKSGTLYEEKNYKNGQLHGKCIRWQGNGQKRSEWSFLNGKMQGKSTFWNENGNKSCEDDSFFDDVLTGTSIYWHDNGNIRSKTFVINGNAVLLIRPNEIRSGQIHAWTCLVGKVFIVFHNKFGGCVYNGSNDPFDVRKLNFILIDEKGRKLELESYNFLDVLPPGCYRNWRPKYRPYPRKVDFEPHEAAEAWVLIGNKKVEMQKERSLAQILKSLGMPKPRPTEIADGPARPESQSMIPFMLIGIVVILILSIIFTYLLEKTRQRAREISSWKILFQNPCSLILIGIFAFLLSSVLILTFGNPQWSKYIYLYQGYIYPKHMNGKIPIPRNYTGVWRRWDWSGMQIEDAAYKNGKLHGKHVSWDRWREYRTEGQYVDGKKDGTFTTWDFKGRKRWERTHAKHGNFTSWHENGKKSRNYTFDQDKMIGIFTEWDEQGKVKERRVTDSKGQILYCQNLEDAEAGHISGFVCSTDGLLIVLKPPILVGKGRWDNKCYVFNTTNNSVNIKSLLFKGQNDYGKTATLRAKNLSDDVPANGYHRLDLEKGKTSGLSSLNFRVQSSSDGADSRRSDDCNFVELLRSCNEEDARQMSSLRAGRLTAICGVARRHRIFPLIRLLLAPCI